MNAKVSFLVVAVAALGLAGCNTKYAEQRVGKPMDEWSHGLESGKESERKNKKYEALSDETPQEEAINILVKQLQHDDRSISIPSEDELRYWAGKQGVGELIVRAVKPLLAHKRLEVRAPALRLTIAYGKKSSTGDLIEVLADEEYGMRSAAFKALRARTGADFGYNAAGGELARAQSLEKFRVWWDEQVNGPKPKETAPEKTTTDQKPGEQLPVVEKPALEIPGRASEVLLPIPKDQQEAHKQ